MLASASVSQAQYQPVAIQSSSYNADIVVESNATPVIKTVTTATVDNGTNNWQNTWFEVGFDTNNPANGLPAAGSTFVAADNASYSFKMAPSYSAPNGIAIDTLVTTGTFTFTTPAAYDKLSFLGSGGNGGDVINVVVHHQDGTTEPGQFGCPDWFGGSGVAYHVGGRCNNMATLTTETDGDNPRIYFRDITLTNTTSPVTSVDLSYASGQASSHNDIMGVSGELTASPGTVVPITVTGYDYDFVVEATATVGGRVVSQIMNDGTNVWATSESMDGNDNTGASWYEQGYNQNNYAKNNNSLPHNNVNADTTWTGLPHAGSYVTNATANHIYQMPPSYTASNAVYFNLLRTNGTITLTTPTAFSGISFLAAAGGGDQSLSIVINHQGGSSETENITIPDWYSGSAPVAYIVNGRVQVPTAELQDVANNNPRLLQVDLPLTDAVNPVTSIDLVKTNVNDARIAIFALSGATGALPPVITQQPVSTKVYATTNFAFTSAASANAPITYQWQKQTNGVFGNLTDVGNISGSTTTTLHINPVGLADQTSYRLVATDSAGFVYSGAATLTVFSTNLDVTQPGDPITGVNISTFGDGPAPTAIDNLMNTKFGANITSGKVPGLKVSPAAGLTVVSGLRIYTGSDSTGRDPASYMVQGSVDGGNHYTLIASNSIVMSDNRNTSSAVAPDPLTQVVTEVDFNNTNGYTTYLVSFPTQKGSGQIQFQEMELLGNTIPGFYFVGQPIDAKGLDQQSSIYFSASANGATSQKWYKGTNGVYVSLSDSTIINGSQSSYLSIYPTTFADAADYVNVAYDGSSYITSSIAHLYIFSTNMDVTQPGDPTLTFGDIAPARFPNNGGGLSFDNTFTEFDNAGSGLNTGAGFSPFSTTGGTNQGCGLVVTPAVGSTVLAGIRFYPGQAAIGNDPADYKLDGSTDGGVSFTTIASGALSLPPYRNDLSLPVDPVSAWAQEILFSNTKGYTTYRLTFMDDVDPATTSFLAVGEIELLGVPGVGVAQPMISTTTLTGGNLNIAGSGGTPNGTYSVVTNGNLTVPVGNWTQATTGTFDASGNFSISLPVSTSNPQLFYLIKTP
jgi:hypothetical protein